MQITNKHIIAGMLAISVIWIAMLWLFTSSAQLSSQEVEAQIKQPYGSSTTSVTPSQGSAELEQRELKLKIDGMFCAGCAQGIQSVLASTPGVLNASVQAPPVSEAIVLYDPSIVSSEQITALDIFGDFSAYKIKEIVYDEEG